MNQCRLLPLKEFHRWNNSVERPLGILSLLTTVYEWNHTATCCHIYAEHAPKKQSAEHAPKSSLQNMPQNAVEKRVLQNAEEVSSRIFTFCQPYRVTSGQIIHSQLLYINWGKTVSHLNANLKEKKKRKEKKPTVLDTTQSTTNITSISIYISLIYN